MVLQKDMACFRFPETGPFYIFTFRNQFTIGIAPSFIFQYFHPIQPVFHVIAFRDNMSPVPFADTVHRFIRVGGYKIVERCQGPAAFMVSQFGVRVPFVIKDLVFQPDGGTGPLVQIGVYKIFDPAVGTFGNFEINFQFEIPVQFPGYDITACGGFRAPGGEYNQLPVFNNPAFFGEFIQAGTPPSGRGAPVPE